MLCQLVDYCSDCKDCSALFLFVLLRCNLQSFQLLPLYGVSQLLLQSWSLEMIIVG